MSKPSPEAMLIIKGMGKKKGDEPSDESESDESESESGADKEGARAAIETMFKALKGRDPTDDEAEMFEDGLDAYCMAKGMY